MLIIIINELVGQLVSTKEQTQTIRHRTALSQGGNTKVRKIRRGSNPQQPVYSKPEPKKEEPEDLEATIFVGNVPLAYTHKNLRRYWSIKISKIWFRSVPVEQTKLGKKANCILKKYQEGADSMNAYVKFEEK